MKQTQEIGQGEAAANILESTNAFRIVIVDNADVWRSGCMGEELSEGDQTIFANIYSQYIATVYWLWLANDIGVVQFDAGSIESAFAANIHRYPGIARIGMSKDRWSEEGSRIDLIGVDRFKAAIQARLAELREIEVEPLSDPDWCGLLS